MTEISSIKVNLETGDKSGAGTDGDVYLGFAAREFFLQTSGDDYERGSSISYVFGEGANVLNAESNDPRTMRVQVEAVNDFPVYIRFAPEKRDDRWLLQRAVVTVNDNLFPMWDTLDVLDVKEGIWMGIRSTLFLHFPEHAD